MYESTKFEWKEKFSDKLKKNLAIECSYWTGILDLKVKVA